MRYSMKWILAAMVYVAIAAAAFSQDSWVYADLLWSATFLAFGYAVLLAGFVPGPVRTRATGFIVLATCYVACAHFAPQTVPTARIESAAFRADTPQTGVALALPGMPQGQTYLLEPERFSAGLYNYARRGLTDEHRAANAIAAMLSGLVGCLLGSLAYNRARRDALQ